MKSIIKYIFFVILFISCTNQKKSDSSEVTDDEIYMIVKMVLKDFETHQKIDGTFEYYLQDELETPPQAFLIPNFDFQKYFSKNDLNFIDKQIVERTNFKLIQDSIKTKKIISKKIIQTFDTEKNDQLNRKDTFIKNYQKKYGSKYYDIISLPLFSKDKKTVLIDVSNIFGGRSMIYKKNNDKWVSNIVISWSN